MVRVVDHGGHCCGARHIYSFGAEEIANPNLINTTVSQVPQGRMIEVILNGEQVAARYQPVLDRLADLGFVLTDHYRNSNHDSHNWRFSRCDRREALNLRNWRGQVINAQMTGNLPDMAGSPMHVGPVPVRREGGWEFEIGEAAGAVVPAQRMEPQRHQNAGELLVQAPAPVPDQPVRTLFVTYHNIYLDGRVGAGYETRDDAERAAPRCRTRRCKQMRSDGTVNWVNL